MKKMTISSKILNILILLFLVIESKNAVASDYDQGDQVEQPNDPEDIGEVDPYFEEEDPAPEVDGEGDVDPQDADAAPEVIDI